MPRPQHERFRAAPTKYANALFAHRLALQQAPLPSLIGRKDHLMADSIMAER